MKIGVSTACMFGRCHIEDAVAEYGRLGIRYAEAFLNTFSEYTPDFIKMLRKTADDNKVKIASVHGYGLAYEPSMFSKYDRSQEDAFKIFEGMMTATEALGADCYVFHGPARLKPARRLTLNFDNIAKVVDRAADMAKEHGVKFAYETVHWCFYNYPGFCEDLNKKIKSDNVYYVFDIKQTAQAGYDPMKFIKKMDGRVANIHMCDFVHEGRYVTPKMPFTGEMDFAQLRDLLKKTGYDGTMMLEVYGDDYGETTELYDMWKKFNEYFG